jgi:hypothetical protein
VPALPQAWKGRAGTGPGNAGALNKKKNFVTGNTTYSGFEGKGET